MKISDGEKLIIWMLLDLYKHHEVSGGINPDFVRDALVGGHHWALEWEYPEIFEGEADAEETVKEVGDILQAWEFVETTYVALSPPDQARVTKETGLTKVEFPGFDGNNESRHLSIARFFIEKMNRFEHFKGRYLNSHSPTLSRHRQMARAFKPKLVNLRHGLSADDLIEILKS